LKKTIAAILTVIFGAFGFVAVDKTVDARLAALESEVAELRIAQQGAVVELQVGDSIQCYPEVPFVIGGYINGETSGELVTYPDHPNKNLATITAMTANILGKEDPNNYNNYLYPFRIKITVEGIVDSKYSGKYIALNFNTAASIATGYSNQGSFINADGSFEAVYYCNTSDSSRAAFWLMGIGIWSDASLSTTTSTTEPWTEEPPAKGFE